MLSQITSRSNDSNAIGEATVQLVDPIDRYSALIVRGAIIGTGVLGLALFIRNSRLFAIYQHVKQIPADYYHRSIPMKGIVREVEPNGLLKVEHRPMVRLPKLFGSKKTKPQTALNLRLAGLEVSPVGTEFLLKDLKLRGHPVSFTVIKQAEREPDITDVDVTAKKAIRNINLNAELVRKGFARVYAPDNRPHMQALQQNRAYSRLITRLVTCEKVAEQRGLGLWERATWVERVQSFPATAIQIVKHSAPTKLAVLSYELLRDFCFALYFFAKQLYFIGIELAKYSVVAYRGVSRGINRAALAYAKMKRQIEQFRSGRGRAVTPTAEQQTAQK